MGDLTIKDVTRQVELLTQFTCSAIDDFGNDKVASLTHAKVSRREIGLTHELIKEAGSLLVGHDLPCRRSHTHRLNWDEKHRSAERVDPWSKPMRHRTATITLNRGEPQPNL